MYFGCGLTCFSFICDFYAFFLAEKGGGSSKLAYNSFDYCNVQIQFVSIKYFNGYTLL